MLVQGLMLDGAVEGILFYIKPQWEQLLNLKVWYAAVTQSFFSLSTGFGALITYSSYNDFKHNSYRDAWIISFTDTFTSLLAGFVIFSILGSLAHELGVPVKDVVDSGPGLAFVSYPSALAKFDVVPQLFSVLFFLMLITLGLGSATGLTTGIITVFCDLYPEKNKVHYILKIIFLINHHLDNDNWSHLCYWLQHWSCLCYSWRSSYFIIGGLFWRWLYHLCYCHYRGYCC